MRFVGGALRQDLRQALRSLRSGRWFALAAILTLGLGTGANAAIFSFVDALAIHQFPAEVWDHPERVLWLFENTSKVDTWRDEVAAANFADWRAQSRTLEALAAMRGAAFTVTGGGEPERVSGYTVSADYFRVLGIRPALGRTFGPGDEKPGQDAVCLLGHAFWKRRFGGDPSVVGRALPLDGRRTTIIGVLPPRFDFPRQANVFVPLVLGPAEWQDRKNDSFAALARLQPGVTQADAQAELDLISRRLEAEHPDTNRELRVQAMRIEEVFSVRGPLTVLLAAVAFVLLIACANVANLQLARGTDRQKELAVRQALGAGRWRVARQLLVESLLLALLGCAVGIVFAEAGVTLLVGTIPESMKQEVPPLFEVKVSGAVLAFALGTAVVGGLLSGVAPALRSSKLDLTAVLKEGGPSGGRGPRRQRLSGALVVVQVMLALVLLAGAAVTIQSFLLFAGQPLGVRVGDVIALQTPLVEPRLREPAQRVRQVEALVERLARLPGVAHAGATSSLPLGDRRRQEFLIEGRPPPVKGDRPVAHVRAVTTDAFATFGIPLVRGRLFGPADRAGASPVAVISDSIARRLFAGEDPLGQRLHLMDRPPGAEEEGGLEIVGIVGDVLEPHQQNPALGDLYLPFAQSPREQAYLVLAAPQAPSLLVAARKAVHETDAEQVVEWAGSMREVVAQTRSGPRLLVVLLGALGVLALLLSALGVYGLVSYAVSQRTHEVGVRMALGASRKSVLLLFARRALRLTGLGIVLGVALSVPLVRGLGAVFFMRSGAVVAPLVLVALLIGAVALLAALVPARRATRVDPMIALRAE